MDWDRLIAAARAAQQKAYAPYSDYAVGTALFSEGEIFVGCNVENASLGATVCAERNAIAAMVMAGKRAIDAVVVVTPSLEPKSPCGMCRQVLSEFHHHGDFEVLSVGSQGERLFMKFSELHPRRFGPKDLDD
jgi:cytidine deaminase